MKAAHVIKAGWGLNVGQDFARMAKDTPIELAPDEYAEPHNTIGYIAPDPASKLGFLRYGDKRGIRVHVPIRAVQPIVEPATA